MNRPKAPDRRKLKRRLLSYYLPVLDNKTLQIIGHLVDISPVGFLMDAKVPINNNLVYDLRLDLMEPVAGKATLEFRARSKWCRPDLINPYLYNAGFEITQISPGGIEVIKLIAEKYATG